MSEIADSHLANVVEVPACPHLQVEPLYLLRPLADYDGEYAVLVSIGNRSELVRPIDERVSENPLRLLHFVILRANSEVKSLINEAYHRKMEMRVGNNSYGFDEWSIVFKGLPSYRPVSAARIVEVSPRREN